MIQSYRDEGCDTMLQALLHLQDTAQFSICHTSHICQVCVSGIDLLMTSQICCVAAG